MTLLSSRDVRLSLSSLLLVAAIATLLLSVECEGFFHLPLEKCCIVRRRSIATPVPPSQWRFPRLRRNRWQLVSSQSPLPSLDSSNRQALPSAYVSASAFFSTHSSRSPRPNLWLFSTAAPDALSVAADTATLPEADAASSSAPAKANDDPNVYPDLPPGCPFPSAEWTQRCALAASYRIAFMEDWGMNIFNHITLKVEGSEAEPDGPHFLLNDYGLGFDEITASSLLKVTVDGTQVGPVRGRVFKPGYVLHSAIHSARDDLHAVWHCHHVDATALCQTTTGLLPLSQEATFALAKGLSYHPFEGSANSVEERPRIVANLGPTNKVLLLEDHGPLVAGSTLKEAYSTMWFLTRACQYQIRATSSVGGDLSRIHIPSDEIRNEMDRRAEKFDEAPAVAQAKSERNSDGGGEVAVEKHDTEGLMFACARRAAERLFGAENIYV